MTRTSLSVMVVAGVLAVLTSLMFVPTQAAFVDDARGGAAFAAAEAFPPFAVSGQVTSTQDGSGVAGATVTLDDGAGATRTATTDGAGDYTVADVPPGTYEGSAGGSGFVSSSAQGLQVAGDLTGVNFAVTPLYRVEGRVTTWLGTGISRATVTFTHHETGEVQRTTTFTSGLTAGIYHLPDVRAGAHTVTLSRPLAVDRTEQVTITTNRIRGTNALDFRTNWTL